MRRPRSSNALWTDAELADAVDAYVFLLRAQSTSVRFPAEVAANALLEDALPGRNDASLRYRFRNISAVVRELGGPVLRGFTPAEQVGAGVRPRIRSLLLASQDFRDLLDVPHATLPAPPQPGDRDVALEAIARLRRSLDDIEREVLGIGHNNPPEPMYADSDRRGAFENVRRDIVALQSEMQKPTPDKVAVEAHSLGLVQFGVKMAAWIGQRTTKFTDKALAVLAPVVVAKVTGLLPILVEAIRAVGRVVGQ